MASASSSPASPPSAPISRPIRDTLCPICTELLFNEEKEVRWLPCAHAFHRSCINQWLQHRMSCPLCKRCARTGREINEEKEAIPAARPHRHARRWRNRSNPHQRPAAAARNRRNSHVRPAAAARNQHFSRPRRPYSAAELANRAAVRNAPVVDVSSEFMERMVGLNPEDRVTIVIQRDDYNRANDLVSTYCSVQ